MPTFEWLEGNAPEGWFSRYDMAVFGPEVQSLKRGDVYLEIGVHKGRSLWTAVQLAKSGVELYGIDTGPNPDIPWTSFLRGDSKDVAWDSAINLLFIDGNHSYEGVKADIDKYWPFVVSGGTILFHDCDETSPGVVQAVAEFAGREKLSWEMLKTTDLRTSMAKVKI